MLRLIIIFCLFSMVWRLIRSLINFLKVNSNSKNNSTNNSKNQSKKLIKCATCNLYVPIEDAVYYNNNFFCCKEHVYQNN